MDQTILTFQVPVQVKQALKKKSSKAGKTISEYLRNIVNQDLGISGNPWLDMIGILDESEAQQMRENIQKSRVSRTQKKWKEISNLAQ
ncbi:MAG: hypothetical protein WCK98_03540 [bacterium]